MGASKIEQLIEDIYEFVESCRMQPLSSTKVIVPKDELYDLLDELKLRTPDEIKRYQKIISNRDSILADAEAKAESVIAQAAERAKELLNEHEIMQQAYYEANEMLVQASEEAEKVLSEAREESEQIKKSSLVYCNDILSEVERVMNSAYDTANTKFTGFIDTLKSNLDIINNNKKELDEQLNPKETTKTQNEEGDVSEEATDFGFDENEFFIDVDTISDKLEESE